MKKIASIFMGLFLVMTLSACQEQTTETCSSDSTNTNSPNQSGSATEGTQELGKTLVVYFSVPETQDPNNMTQEEENSVVVIDGKVLGNTEYVATVIQQETNADLFRIEPKTPYLTDHEDLIDLAKEEQNENARPALAEQVSNIEEYDTIFLGYPNWWGDLPMILYTFLETTDLSGKQVIPFNTHGGSGVSNTIQTIKEQIPDENVEENGLTISRDDVQDSENQIKDWVASFQ